MERKKAVRPRSRSASPRFKSQPVRVTASASKQRAYLAYIYHSRGVFPFPTDMFKLLFPDAGSIKIISQTIRGQPRGTAAHIGFSIDALEVGRAALLEKLDALLTREPFVYHPFVVLPSVDALRVKALQALDKHAIRSLGARVHLHILDQTCSPVAPPTVTSRVTVPPAFARVAGEGDGMGAVVAMLTRAKLVQYAQLFDELGYDDLPFLRMMPRERLEAVAAHAHMKTGHVARFLVQMREEGAPC